MMLSTEVSLGEDSDGVVIPVVGAESSAFSLENWLASLNATDRKGG